MATACLVACLVAPSARASGLAAAVADCNAHGTLTQNYSVPQLRQALATLPADVAEYSDCHDVIERQLLGQLRRLSGAGPGAGGGAFVPTAVAVVLVLLGLAAAAYAGLMVRRRRAI